VVRVLSGTVITGSTPDWKYWCYHG